MQEPERRQGGEGEEESLLCLTSEVVGVSFAAEPGREHPPPPPRAGPGSENTRPLRKMSALEISEETKR